MAKIVKGTRTNEWLPPNLRKSTFPVLNQPAKTSNDIRGSAFLITYNKIAYIVTAKHVIETNNPVIAFSKKDRQVFGVSQSALQQLGLRWVKHPAALDLAAIPFILSPSLVKELDSSIITEDKWVVQTNVKVGDEVAHLGYPEKGCSNYTDGSLSTFPQGMPGKIIQVAGFNVWMETAAAHGASGGPVFLRMADNSPYLIGVVTDVVMYGMRTRPEEGEYCNRTKSLVASLIKDVLEAEEMKEQIQEFGNILLKIVNKKT